MGNKSGVLVAKIFLWMLEMLLKWAPKINSFPGKAFRVTQWKLSNLPQFGLSQSLYINYSAVGGEPNNLGVLLVSLSFMSYENSPRLSP